MKTGKLGKQFKKANNAGVRWVVVCGPDDLASNTVQVKDLENGTQETVPRADLVSKVSV